MIRELLSEVSKDRFIEYMSGITRDLDKSFKQVLHKKYISLHFVGLLIAAPIMLFKIDWYYFKFFRELLWLQIFLFPAAPIGGYVPVLVPAGLYLYGKNRNKPYLFALAFVLTQAGLVAVFWSALYKSITGRVGPEIFENDDKDYSLDFAFGILRRGVFEGWPSTHTSVAWAMAIALWICLPKIQQKYEIEPLDYFDLYWLRMRKFGFMYAIYISFAVSTNIHWLSDVVMGVFVGISSGYATSKIFLETWNEDLILERSTVRVKKFSLLIMILLFFTLWDLDEFLRI